METKLIPINQIETTCNLINACDFEEAIKYASSTAYSKVLYLQTVEFGEVNYERKSDWMRLINKLDRYDTTPIQRMITGNKKSLDWGGCIVSREDIEFSEDGFLIEFKQPMDIVVETVNDKYVVVTAKKIKGQFSWEWLARKEGHEALGNYCGVLDIFMHNIEIVE